MSDERGTVRVVQGIARSELQDATMMNSCVEFGSHLRQLNAICSRISGVFIKLCLIEWSRLAPSGRVHSRAIDSDSAWAHSRSV